MRANKMKEAKIKAGRYCTYQERTQQEVRNKLYEIGLYKDEVEEILTDLITENYVNEARYAKTFASGKFRIKHWGRNKIEYALKQKNISAYCIDLALKEISDEEYHLVITQLINKKAMQIADDQYIKKNKIARYIIGKGFESELVWKLIHEHLPV